ncbi:MAG: Der GTPase-activating protein YihI [Hafnia sp.]|jgi:ribosome assembly protein YihI (activator of Der GTPase)|uniref:Der GTPase-activating protein YihI n=1 Tax=Obesumbacterium proteus ATCC 12841 TaxID=1354268 RepID=A0AA91IQF5_9GAMM|nr:MULTISPECIES: Der GTPase-activating protein YihI [Hafniaceae]AMO80201.1 GTPase-activating protein [Obesumbacterium proteus]KKI41434.1 GTPase activator [Obesumbacterium proteus]MCE9884042.1 Der GTPase-activating protein YihI [Obesumbacterium proteus]MCE9918268.1 Der GTPase-activating protein YihI [Obesumbacterium proteus]MCE9930025.1 Der GTPase-activating protein YihI [Obesumbacterium proteus]
MSPANKTPKAKTSAPKQKRKTRVELDLEARARKRQKKHRGNKSGGRANPEAANKKTGDSAKVVDPRIGSKVPVSLVATEVKKPKAKAPKPEAKKRLTPEEELTQLENDPRLDELLIRLDDGEDLNQEEQSYVDNMLDRIDALMEELGIELGDEDDEVDEEEPKEDIVKLLKRGNPKDVF